MKTTEQIVEDCGLHKSNAELIDAMLSKKFGPARGGLEPRCFEVIEALFRRIQKLEEPIPIADALPHLREGNSRRCGIPGKDRVRDGDMSTVKRRVPDGMGCRSSGGDREWVWVSYIDSESIAFGGDETTVPPIDGDEIKMAILSSRATLKKIIKRHEDREKTLLSLLTDNERSAI